MGQTESGMNWFLTSRLWARVPSAWLSSHRFMPFAHGWRGKPPGSLLPTSLWFSRFALRIFHAWESNMRGIRLVFQLSSVGSGC